MFLSSLNDHIIPSQVMLTIEFRRVNKLWARSSISFQDMSFWFSVLAFTHGHTLCMCMCMVKKSNQVRTMHLIKKFDPIWSCISKHNSIYHSKQWMGELWANLGILLLLLLNNQSTIHWSSLVIPCHGFVKLLMGSTRQEKTKPLQQQ